MSYQKSLPVKDLATSANILNETNNQVTIRQKDTSDETTIPLNEL